MFGLPTAQMTLPVEFEPRAERKEITGFGGHNKGTFEIEGYRGEFTRGESRFSVKKSAIVSNKGKSSFTLRDESASEIVSASCAMGKNSVTIGIVSFDPKKMTYQCDFIVGGQVVGARLALGQPRASGTKEKFFAKDLRRGESDLFGQHLLIESVHNYKESKFQSPAPVGYLILSDDKAVAALELTDVNPSLVLARDTPDELKRAVLATALALAVLRDPANSALEED
jgi:hypothetical protein